MIMEQKLFLKKCLILVFYLTAFMHINNSPKDWEPYST